MDRAVLGTYLVWQVTLFQRGLMCPGFSLVCHLEKGVAKFAAGSRRGGVFGHQQQGLEMRTVLCGEVVEEGTGHRGL